MRLLFTAISPSRTLRRNLSVPVSVKIRLLDSPEETVEFARRMEKAGACALTVHVRYAAVPIYKNVASITLEQHCLSRATRGAKGF